MTIERALNSIRSFSTGDRTSPAGKLARITKARENAQRQERIRILICEIVPRYPNGLTSIQLARMVYAAEGLANDDARLPAWYWWAVASVAEDMPPGSTIARLKTVTTGRDLYASIEHCPAIVASGQATPALEDPDENKTGILGVPKHITRPDLWLRRHNKRR